MGQKNSQTHKFEIKNFKDVYDYCYLNGIMDINSFVDNCFKQGFDIEKYGLLGKTLNDGEKDLKTSGVQEKWVEKEVIVEKRVEVPVEVIKEVEKIVEVIKEVPVDRVVEKIIKTSDDTQINELLSKIEQLNGEISIKCLEIDKIRQEFSTKTKEMENIFQNEMSKKDKELDELRHKLDIPVTNSKVNMLQETLVKLKKELTEKNQQNDNLKSKIEELESIKINQGAVFMKGSNLTENL
jgi:hypothetical protein